MMQRRDDRELMRLLHGELSPERAAALRRRLAAEPALAAAYRRLEASWNGLELPPPAAVPPGFARRVAGRAAAGREAAGHEAGMGWRTSPAWARLGAALALAAGLALGVGLGSWQAAGQVDSLVLVEEPQGLAESYWQALARGGEAAAAVGTEADEGSGT